MRIIFTCYIHSWFYFISFENCMLPNSESLSVFLCLTAIFHAVWYHGLQRWDLHLNMGKLKSASKYGTGNGHPMTTNLLQLRGQGCTGLCSDISIVCWQDFLEWYHSTSAIHLQPILSGLAPIYFIYVLFTVYSFLFSFSMKQVAVITWELEVQNLIQ